MTVNQGFENDDRALTASDAHGGEGNRRELLLILLGRKIEETVRRMVTFFIKTLVYSLGALFYKFMRVFYL